MTTPVSLPPKLVGETLIEPVDYTTLLPTGVTIASAAVTAGVYLGVDATPTDILSGNATVAGAVVSQEVIAGLPGVDYLLTYAATCSDGEVIEQERILPVTAFR
jgi:hypothetical protein